MCNYDEDVLVAVKLLQPPHGFGCERNVMAESYVEQGVGVLSSP